MLRVSLASALLVNADVLCWAMELNAAAHCTSIIALAISNKQPLKSVSHRTNSNTAAAEHGA
jgi:hypothetical protein